MEPFSRPLLRGALRVPEWGNKIYFLFLARRKLLSGT